MTFHLLRNFYKRLKRKIIALGGPTSWCILELREPKHRWIWMGLFGRVTKAISDTHNVADISFALLNLNWWEPGLPDLVNRLQILHSKSKNESSKAIDAFLLFLGIHLAFLNTVKWYIRSVIPASRAVRDDYFSKDEHHRLTIKSRREVAKSGSLQHAESVNIYHR